MAVGAIGGLAELTQGGFNYASAKEREEAARKWLEQAMADRQAGVNMAQNLDWSPERVRDQVGVFQRSRSPVADAFLESFVTGDNPAAVQGTRYGAKIDKADAQRRFDKNYGGWDAIRAQQRQLDQSTPWAVQNPSGFTYGEEKSADKLSPEEVRKLEELGHVKVSARGELMEDLSDKNTAGAGGRFNELSWDTKKGDKGWKALIGTPEYIERLRRYIAELEKTGGQTYNDIAAAAKNSQFETYDNGGA